jgi:hypothetical protein
MIRGPEPIDLRATVQARLDQLPFVTGLRMVDISASACSALDEGTSASFTQGVQLNDNVAILLNHWGWARSHNRYSFTVFDRMVGGRWEQAQARIDHIDDAIALAIQLLAAHALIAAGVAHDR